MLMRMEGGANPYHPIMQGFSSAHRENAGTTAAVYEPLSCGDDNYVFATACDYRRRHLAPLWPHMGFNTPSDVQTERAWILDVLRRFPADGLARVYACVLRTVGYGDAYAPTKTEKALLPRWPAKLYPSFASHMNRFGVYYVGLLLFLLGLRSLFEASMALLFLLYFCGYVSLQCEFRHAFHLSFVPFWIAGFLLNTVWLLCRPGPRGRIRASVAASRQSLAGRARRSLLFLLAALLFLMGPLWVARVWQVRTVDRMLATYAEADVAPLPVEKEPLGDWVLFRMAASPAQRVHSVTKRAVILGLLANAMPLYPPLEAILWRAFRGWCIDPPMGQVAHYETIGSSPDWTRYHRAEVRGIEAMAEAEAGQGRIDGAIFLLRAGFAMTPSRHFLEQIFRLQQSKGDVPGVTDTYSRMIRLAPGDHCMHREVDRFLQERCAPRQRADIWRDVGDAHPDFAPAFVLLGRALEDTNDLEGAEDAYRAALAKDPEVLMPCFVGDVLLGADQARRMRFWKRMAGQHPGSASVHSELGNVLFEIRDFKAAAQAYARAAAIRPDTSWMLANLGRAQYACGDYAPATETLQKVLALAPDMNYLRHDLIDALLKVGRPEAAARQAEVYESAGGGLNPELRARLNEANDKALP